MECANPNFVTQVMLKSCMNKENCGKKLHIMSILSWKIEGLRKKSTERMKLPCFHFSLVWSSFLIPNTNFMLLNYTTSKRKRLFVTSRAVKWNSLSIKAIYILLSVPLGTRVKFILKSADISLTVEPCLTTTPFIRPPRYYGHILSNQT